MTDREMLQLAAKAAGLEVCQSETLCLSDWLLVREVGDPYPFHQRWCPLHDDGDALWLAVKLGISVLSFPACIGTRWPQNGLPVRLIGFDPPYEDISSGQDVFAAARRAITRAAAEIGKSMETRP